MIKILNKAEKRELPEMIVNAEDVQYSKHLPTCPQCKGAGNVFIFNVTNRIYECSGCNLRFLIARKTGLSIWKSVQ